MDRDNIINRRLFEWSMSNLQAAEKISKIYKVELSEQRFLLIKNGHDITRKYRIILADFFGINEKDIPCRAKWKKQKGGKGA